MQFLSKADYDLAVVGGGAAGVAAAVTAGRLGLKTVLIEKYGFCGGAAVAGLSGTICGLFGGTEDADKPPVQLVYGFAQEFRDELDKIGGVTEAQRYGKTWTVTFDNHKWRDAADKMLTESGVSILYHCQVVGTVSDGDSLSGLKLHHSGNEYEIRASRIIDATGDASVVHMAGGETYLGDRGAIQNPSYMFNLADVDVQVFLDYWCRRYYFGITR